MAGVLRLGFRVDDSGFGVWGGRGRGEGKRMEEGDREEGERGGRERRERGGREERERGGGERKGIGWGGATSVLGARIVLHLLDHARGQQVHQDLLFARERIVIQERIVVQERIVIQQRESLFNEGSRSSRISCFGGCCLLGLLCV